MILNLIPQFGRPEITVSVAGDVLTIDSEAFDFADLDEGSTLPAGSVGHELMPMPITRTDGQVIVPLILPIGDRAPIESQSPVTLTVGDGPVTLPIYDEPLPEIEGDDDAAD